MLHKEYYLVTWQPLCKVLYSSKCEALGLNSWASLCIAVCHVHRLDLPYYSAKCGPNILVGINQ